MAKKRKFIMIRALSLAVTLLLFPLSHVQAQEHYDVIIRNGRVLDGTGNPWFHGDVAIKDGKIAAVGPLTGATADEEIDALVYELYGLTEEEIATVEDTPDDLVFDRCIGSCHKGGQALVTSVGAPTMRKGSVKVIA